MRPSSPRRAGKLPSGLFWLLTVASTLAVCLLVVVIVGNILFQGIPQVSWRLISGSTATGDMFNLQTAGLFPMIFGTVALVLLMTVVVMPVGVATAVCLQEYAKQDSWLTRVIRASIINLAGVPSIVFGLFGLGFFVYFLGGLLDKTLNGGALVWGQPALIWAALTMAALTLPVVIVSTEEALRAVPSDHRDASLALGATRLQTLTRVVLPQAVPGILTGGILAVSRGAGEVAPIMFTGAVFYMPGLPQHLSQQFMHLGYHTFILSTQSPNIEATKPILYATVCVLLVLTVALNAVAVALRAYMQRKR